MKLYNSDRHYATAPQIYSDISFRKSRIELLKAQAKIWVKD